MSTASNEKRIKQYRESVKAKLKVHYLSRIFYVLEVSGYTFKTRSTNWKGSKFYSQMLCSNDIYTRKDEEGTSSDSYDTSSHPLYACKSRFNYSFDTTSGQFHADFAHLTHHSLPSLASIHSRFLAHPSTDTNTSNIAEEESEELSATPSFVYNDGAVQIKQPEEYDNDQLCDTTFVEDENIYLRQVLTKPSGDISTDPDAKPPTSFACALNSLHQNISSNSRA
ncbi:hypothetical protein FOA43_001911 [Brettanomyces nanus]|uniref:Uncharacterized protein n=1 Tax=Eeniella nana TaxID=13502 RepID=A0A875RP51_EENNA|nr:uncharacterized protein FOA43_001911 [Brettanomyces nanus]QPG74580.1 hypothetical protein FOA43_001911 [Brettanomyces nanus]